MRLRSDVTWMRDADGAGSLFSASSGGVFALNPAAACVLHGVCAGEGLDSLAARLTATFDVSEEEAAEDVRAFLRTLTEHGLVQE